ncbi:hypothetical protein ASG04_14550 [Curtobacterium sp. Leaf183]|uniref:BREX-2 system phosphatase PglZ n=1 Tax=Curtobacterium sp. Leaf183 TaxID=1736291 RepID=UPI0006F4AFCA|nr:BREX-2 system phosphatase PglZ [Curtobacterium sp. Leaf183]KQS08322.1 hypothetical protein ASG04_14550 [Curtobacterium sp. Leaf183]
MAIPIATETALRDHVAAWLKKPRPARTVLVRAQPAWSGQRVLTVGEARVHVIEGVSGLAALDAMRSVPDGEYVAVLTDLTEAQLGSAVVLDASPQQLTDLDEWAFVASAFGVRDDSVPRPVKELGNWLPRLLADWRRERNYPQLPSGAVLTPGHVIRSLLLALLGLGRPEDLDLSTALAPLDDATARMRLQSLAADARLGFIQAVAAHTEPHLALALTAASRLGNVSPIAVGLAAGELWTAGSLAPNATVAAARVRAEEYLGRAPSAAAVQRFGGGAKLITQRWLASGDRHATEVLEQAEALCGEWGWADGAAGSALLPAGLRVRIAAFAAAIDAAVATPTPQTARSVERALAAIDGHSVRASFDGSRPTAQMAARLVRWLVSSVTPTAGLSGALQDYATDGAWAERALGDIWDGDTDRGLARAYGALALAVQAKRRDQDRAASALLTGASSKDERVTPVEDLLARTVVPLAARNGVLLIVLDGMSVPTAAELVPELTGLGWAEVVREGQRHRGVALAALPTVTQYSRTSLFAGELLDGHQQIEKSRFTSGVNGVVLHKDDLRSRPGFALPEAVTDAIGSRTQKIVAAVLNTIDDALASADVDALRWTPHSIANLEALLAAAQDAGRLVILTSDHGHIVERGSELRNVPGSPARWRDAGGAPAGSDEVLVAGPRVLAPGGQAILAVSDGLRYTTKKAGYHGGASLAELTIPVVVLKRQGADDPVGWVEAPPQEPTWWNEPSRAETSAASAARPAPKAKTKSAKVAAPTGPTLFGTEPEQPAVVAARAGASLGTSLVSAATYSARRNLAGRHPVEDTIVATIVDSLEAGGGRAHRDTLAVQLGIAAHTFAGLLTTLRRVLNVDGYPVVDTDADGVTVVLDIPLLREQFELGGA